MSMRATGFEQMQGELKLIHDALEGDSLRLAVRAAGRVVSDSMAERAPILDDRTANSTALPQRALKDGIRVLSVRKDAAGFIVAIIGPRRGTGQAAHLVEYGHRLIKGGKSRVGARGAVGPGKQIGEVPAHPFLRPAFDSSWRQALKEYADQLKQILARWTR